MSRFLIPVLGVALLLAVALAPFPASASASASAEAPSCLEYDAVPWWQAVHQLPSRIQALSVRDGIAHVGLAIGGFRTLDISDPRTWVPLGELGGIQAIGDIGLVGDHAVMTRVAVGIAVVDVSDPARPVQVGELALPGRVGELAVVDRWAVVGAGYEGIFLVDLGVPSSPVVSGRLFAGENVAQVVRDETGQVFVVIRGRGIARLADVRGGVLAVEEVADSDAFVVDLVAVAGVVHVAGGGGVLATWDARGSGGMREVSRQRLPVFEKLAAEGDVLVGLADGRRNIWVFDRSNPLAPSYLGDVSLTGTQYGLAGTALALADGHVVRGDAEGHVMTRPTAVAGMRSLTMPGWVTGMAPSGDRLVVVSLAGIDVVERTDDGRLVRLGGLHFPGEFRAELGGVVDGHLILERGDRLQVYDVSDATGIVCVRDEPLAYGFGRLHLGDHILFARQRGGFAVYDLSDPASPVDMGYWETASLVDIDPLRGAAAGRALFMDFNGGVKVADFNTGPEPTWYDYPAGISVGYARVIGTELHAVRQRLDIRDPAAPRVVGPSVDSARFVGWSGNQIYDATDSGLRVRDTSGGFEELGVHPVPRRFSEDIAFLPGGAVMRRDSTIVYVPLQCGNEPWDYDLLLEADRQGRRADCRPGRGMIGVTVFTAWYLDATTIDPASIRCGPGDAIPSGPRAVTVVDADGDGRDDIRFEFDREDLAVACTDTAFTITGRTRDGTPVHGTIPAMRHGRASEPDTGGGDGPVLSASPNPFNPMTSIRLEQERPGKVRLVVYDLSGRQVRTLHEGMLPPGHHEFTWRGRDDAGRGVASGVYLVRSESSAGIASRRLLLMK